MTTYKFSESLSLANSFAIHLLSGTLNMQIDYDSSGASLVEITYEKAWFSTDIMERVRIMSHRYMLSGFEATDIAKNPNSMWSEGEIRHISIFARDLYGIEQMIAAFDVARDFLDGDEVVGWTRWRVQNVRIHPDSSREFELSCERIHRNDDYVVWGRRICPTI